MSDGEHEKHLTDEEIEQSMDFEDLVESLRWYRDAYIELRHRMDGLEK